MVIEYRFHVDFVGLSFGHRRCPKSSGKEQGKKQNKKLDLQHHWKLETKDYLFYFILFLDK